MERPGRGRGQLARDPGRSVRLGHQRTQADILVFDAGQVDAPRFPHHTARHACPLPPSLP